MLLLLFKLLQRFIIVSVLLSVFIHVVITKPINNSINNDRLSAPIPDQLDILFATPDDAELYSSLSNIDTTQNLQSDRNEPFTILNNENIQVTPSEFPHDSTLGELMPNQISYQNYEKVSSKELAVHKHYAYLAKETFCQRKANKIQSAQVFVSERQTKGLLILGFSGDEDYSPLPYRIMQSEPTEFPGISNSKVLKSLYKPYEEWAAANLDRIVESLKKLSGVSNIVLTGFGLGGAYAQFAAVSLNLKSTAQLKISVYAFGTPQVGNRPFVDALSSNINESQFGKIQQMVLRIGVLTKRFVLSKRIL
ncbi:hypothetical protein G9A89_002290 [Geosiphon pyriformis]|nr:hypothetical protein G9A89_000922 [Geosiphon pyriformis]KAG9289517.1 hypothetical protein G9A89_002290 [Geosiphon pyriformis]